MAQSFKAAISFGLIHIPVTFSKVISSNKISFNLLDKKTLKRIRYNKTTENSEKEVDTQNIVKGYQYQDDQYVVLTDDDFKSLRASKEQTITIENFADISDIDPICYNRSYYLTPGKNAERPFLLFMEGLATSKKVAVARFFIRGNEELAIMRIQDDILYLITLHYYDEINARPFQVEDIKLTKDELTLAKNLIKTMSKKFQHKNYKNQYNEDIKKLIESKIKGQKVKVKKEKVNNQALDLMIALEKSLKMNNSARR